ncbi:MAG: sodium-translocating pyrophosphatase [Candidatus Thermoplasmatota archaeon]|nr:sodium-translocating pyrophosphatase [Candidatus Thermoplasmatota archaeon]
MNVLYPAFVLAGALIAIVYAFFLMHKIRAFPPGTKEMVEVSGYVREGAKAYLKKQYKTIAIVFVVLFFILLIMSFLGYQASMLVPFAFASGGILSALSGYIGMNAATMANTRAANGARDSFAKGFNIAFSSGGVMGFVVVGFGLLLVAIWLLALVNTSDLRAVSGVLLACSMGASFIALFARVGGGVFTKAADVGADLVGKVEAGIPEDDPRNAAVIADNVGDNVGDVAGMGADLYESYLGAMISAIALGASAYGTIEAMFLPVVIAAIGVFSSMVGMLLVRIKDEKVEAEVLLKAMRRGNYSTALLVVVLSFFAIYLLSGNYGLYISLICGLLVGVLIGRITEHYTSEAYEPVKRIAESSSTGPATVILEGMSTGMVSAVIPCILISMSIIASYYLSGSWDSGFEEVSQIHGLYGIAISAVGMLSTLGFTLSTDAYGPVADNAGGLAEMCGLGKEVRARTDTFDSMGNTTAATGKGFAIGSAALTAAALIATYKDNIDFMVGESLTLDLMDPRVLVAVFIGAMLPFLFSSWILSAVGRAASAMVEEVRAQFHREGVMEGKVRPDYARCVEISTGAALREMVMPALLAVIAPLVIGILLGPQAVAGLLIGALASGFILAIYMANAGGAWDNAKKYIEDGNLGGKGSEAHKASVVGDTVGDPMKDAAGPSINILIKLMSVVAIVFSALFFLL